MWSAFSASTALNHIMKLNVSWMSFVIFDITFNICILLHVVIFWTMCFSCWHNPCLKCFHFLESTSCNWMCPVFEVLPLPWVNSCNWMYPECLVIIDITFNIYILIHIVIFWTMCFSCWHDPCLKFILVSASQCEVPSVLPLPWVNSWNWMCPECLLWYLISFLTFVFWFILSYFERCVSRVDMTRVWSSSWLVHLNVKCLQCFHFLESTLETECILNVFCDIRYHF